MDLEFPGFDELTEIGRGGMSAVYRARDVALDRWVALKVLAAELAADPGFRARFIAESKTVAGLDHPHIIPVYAAGQVSDRLYLAMRYVPGADLGRLISRCGPLTLDRTADLIAQVAGALDAAHAAGLVHRDVKPANILVEDRPGGAHCWLSDFGITKRLSAAPSEITATGALLGTPEYAAPEQIRGARVDARTDVYGLGCVTYKCLTGSSPFPRDSYAAVLAAHLTEPPPAPSAARPGLPAAVDAVVATALAKNPDDRYPTCAALAGALHDIADRASDEPTSPTGARVVAGRQPSRRLPVALGLGALAVALVAVALAVMSRVPAPPQGDPVLLSPSAVTATSTAPSGVDSASRVVTYEPDHVTDHDLATAWRTPGDGAGQQVRLEFPEPVRIDRIGLVPGYAKIDPVDGTDRFTQNRTIASVRYLFDDGTAVTAVFEARPDLQFTQVEVVTRTVTVEIVATTAPGGRDFTPISEIEVYGWPA